MLTVSIWHPHALQRVKILAKKTTSAFVQFRASQHAQFAIAYLKGIDLD